jgi:hypothetical protein
MQEEFPDLDFIPDDVEMPDAFLKGDVDSSLLQVPELLVGSSAENDPSPPWSPECCFRKGDVKSESRDSAASHARPTGDCCKDEGMSGTHQRVRSRAIFKTKLSKRWNIFMVSS